MAHANLVRRRLRFALAGLGLTCALASLLLPADFFAGAGDLQCPQPQRPELEALFVCFQAGDHTLGWTLRGLWSAAALLALPLATAPLARALRTSQRQHMALRIQLGLRAACVILATLALSNPQLRTPSFAQSLVVAVDRSASSEGRAKPIADHLFAELRQAAEDHRAGGGDRLDPEAFRRIDYAKHILEDPDGETATESLLASEHANAIEYAQSLLSPDREGHLLFISDGLATAAGQRDFQASTSRARARGVDIALLRVAPNDAADLRVDTLHLPLTARLGQTLEVSVDVHSLKPTTVDARLIVDDKLEDRQENLDLEAGPSRLRFQLRPKQRGTRRVRVELHSNGNLETQTKSLVVVQGRPRALVVASEALRNFEAALSAGEIDSQWRAPAKLTAEELREFDVLILADVHAQQLRRGLASAIRAEVEDQGMGLLMLGGERSFGLGGWNHSPLAHTLPVRARGQSEEQTPALALMLVIDKSGSMASQDKIELVKQASLATARTLAASDEIAVIAFDSRPHVLVRLQAARNRAKIARSIRRLSAGGGTHALPALREAQLQLSASRARVKHIILLSDGQSPSQGIDALLADMRDAGITVSSIGVGAGAGKELLAEIAEQGQGRYYFSADGSDVPRIFSRETKAVTRNSVHERRHQVRVVTAIAAHRGLRFRSAPPLLGLVQLQKKPNSQVVLTTTEAAPLYVTARRGLGKTAAFASDAGQRWAAPWLDWSDYARFWGQSIRDLARPGAGDQSRRLPIHVEGSNSGAWRFDVSRPQTSETVVGDALRFIVEDGFGREVASVPAAHPLPGHFHGEWQFPWGNNHESPPLLVRTAATQATTPQTQALGRIPSIRIAELDPRHQYRLEGLPEVADTAAVLQWLETRARTQKQSGQVSRFRERATWPALIMLAFLPLLLGEFGLARWRRA